MNNRAYRDILLVAFLIFAAGPACIVTSSSAPSLQSSANSRATVPERNSQVLGDLGSIAYTLDTARQMSKVFDTNSGEGIILTVDDANGYGWMLSIPADALLSTQTITMTPFATIDVSQSGAKIISGVQLEPDGVQFADAVQLLVNAPISNPGVGLIFSIQQDGSDVAFAPTTNTSGGKTAIAQIWHFSSAGYDNSNHAGKDGMDQYKKWAEEDYKLALDAAKQFIKNGPPTPPIPPSISQFCRGTEVNPEEGETYEFTHYFVDPYRDIVNVILSTMKTLELLSEADFDSSDGYYAAQQVMQLAEKSILQLGKQYQGEEPPDRLYAVITTALQVEHELALIGGSPEMMPVITEWAETVRDYYLDQLKTKHDYRAFPILMRLNKDVQLLGGTDRMADILSAMTFEVIIDTSFDATWKSNPTHLVLTGHVEQHADVKDIINGLTPPNFLWGTENNLILKTTTGSWTSPTGHGTLDGESVTGTLYLLNWDACVTKTFDVVLSGYMGDDQHISGTIAYGSSNVSFEQYWWNGGWRFTIPMENLNPTLGDQSFSGSGSKGGDEIKTSGKIHIVIKHTPR